MALNLNTNQTTWATAASEINEKALDKTGEDTVTGRLYLENTPEDEKEAVSKGYLEKYVEQYIKNNNIDRWITIGSVVISDNFENIGLSGESDTTPSNKSNTVSKTIPVDTNILTEISQVRYVIKAGSYVTGSMTKSTTNNFNHTGRIIINGYMSNQNFLTYSKSNTTTAQGTISNYDCVFDEDVILNISNGNALIDNLTLTGGSISLNNATIPTSYLPNLSFTMTIDGVSRHSSYVEYIIMSSGYSFTIELQGKM